MKITRKNLLETGHKLHTLLLEKGLCAKDGSGNVVAEGAKSIIKLLAANKLEIDDTVILSFFRFRCLVPRDAYSPLSLEEVWETILKVFADDDKLDRIIEYILCDLAD